MESTRVITNGCMGTDKPLISILMAIYEPRFDWLREQLRSLEAQTYSNLKVYIRDDCSPTVSHEEIAACVKECIRSFPYELRRNEVNLGSNRTFEELTREAEGEYFAYCDQDDVWLPEKLEVLQQELEYTGSLLVCSDMFIIDGEGRQVADSITKVRRHHIFRSGENLTSTLWYSNFASGCALLVRSAEAKAAVPFNPHMYYDHYITLYCANLGRVTSVLNPLILHREHGSNQSSTLQGVVDRDSYRRIRVDTVVNAMEWLNEHFRCGQELKETLSQGLEWMIARQQYCSGDRRNWKVIWRYRRFSPVASLFELCMPMMPEFLFKLCLWASRKNLI